MRADRVLHWDHNAGLDLVHRDSIAEVLLTDLIQLGDTDFLVAAQWPRSHRVYRPDRNGRHDPMLILESIRQSGLAVSHLGFGVGFDQQSLMRDVSFVLDQRTEPRALLRATDLSIAVSCRDVITRAGRLRGMTLDLSFALRARGGIRLDWDQLRWSSTIPPRLPSAIRATADVLISADSGPGPRRRLVVPLDHPVYFDHALDHAPGMLLIDAAWQAAAEQRGDGARLISCTLDCPAFTELGVDTDILLRPTSSDTTEFTVHQHGHETASGTLRVAPVR